MNPRHEIYGILLLASLISFGGLFLTKNPSIFSRNPSQQLAQVSGSVTPAFVQAKTNRVWNPSTVSVTFDAVSAGNLIAFSTKWESSAVTLNSVTATCGSGNLHLVDNPIVYSPTKVAAQGYGIISTSGQCTVTANFSGPAGGWVSIMAHEVSGVDTSNPLDGHATNKQDNAGTAADAVTSGTITTTSSGNYIFGSVWDVGGNGAMYSAGSGFSKRISADGISGGGATEDKIQSTAGSVAATFTQSVSWADSIAMVMAFRGGTSSNPPPPSTSEPPPATEPPPPTTTSGVITAPSCSQADVQNAINSAVDGNTVMVPAGSCTWTVPSTGGAAVTINSKSLILKGAGMGATKITLAGAIRYTDSLLHVSMTSDKPFRITGFTFNGDGLHTYIYITGVSKQFRVDHINNTLDTTSPTRLVITKGYTYGVIDHIQGNHNNVGGEVGAVLVIGEDSPAKKTGNMGWMRNLELGTANAVYVENSTFTGPANSFSGYSTDVSDGGRMVLRYNTYTNVVLGTHGAQSSGGRGVFSWEIYNNTFTTTARVYRVQNSIRGGTGVIFNNTYNFLNGAYGSYIGFDNPRSHTLANQIFGGKCDGTNSWDMNQLSNGYPCLDQIGRSTGDPGNQRYEPAYEWNNFTGSGADVEPAVINPPSDTHIVKGRDFFTNTPRPGYIPYTYPHPLTLYGFTGDDPTKPLPPPTSPAPLTPQTTTPPPSTTLIGDFYKDGQINSLDVSMMAGAWNTNNATYDLTKDGIVNTLDFSIVVQNWTR